MSDLKSTTGFLHFPLTLPEHLKVPVQYILCMGVLGGSSYYMYQMLKHRKRQKSLTSLRNTLDSRKPFDLWNTAIFFPDYSPSAPNSKTSQLLWYFDNARISIQICIYNSSLRQLEEVIVNKHRAGLMVQVVTGHEWTAKTFLDNGIKVGQYVAEDEGKESLMHNKFVVIDGEAVISGSLNWTLEAITGNRENVVITTEKRIVQKYVQQFYFLLKKCESNKTLQ